MFDASTIQRVSAALSLLPDAPNSDNPLVSSNNGFEPKDEIYPIIHELIIDPIARLMGEELHLTHGMLLKAYLPYRIHTDYVKGDDIPHLAILVPLNQQDIDTHTVIFNEVCLDTFKDFVSTHPKLKHNAQDLHHTLCSHEPIENLEYVSLLAAYKWIPGSFLYWDRKLLHCSDNFRTNGIDSKQALVLFTHTKSL